MKPTPSSKSNVKPDASSGTPLPPVRQRPPRINPQVDAAAPRKAQASTDRSFGEPPKRLTADASQVNVASTEIRDYAVGFRKPPKHTRFKKGRSGNPKGRVKGAKNIWTVLQEEAQAVVSYSENGKPTKASKQTLAIKSAFNKAVKGDLRALQLLMKLFEKYAPAHQAEAEAQGSQSLAERQETDRQILEILGLLPEPEPEASGAASARPARSKKPPTKH